MQQQMCVDRSRDLTEASSLHSCGAQTYEYMFSEGKITKLACQERTVIESHEGTYGVTTVRGLVLSSWKIVFASCWRYGLATSSRIL